MHVQNRREKRAVRGRRYALAEYQLWSHMARLAAHRLAALRSHNGRWWRVPA